MMSVCFYDNDNNETKRNKVKNNSLLSFMLINNYYFIINCWNSACTDRLPD